MTQNETQDHLAEVDGVPPERGRFYSEMRFGAGERIRTVDIHLGKPQTHLWSTWEHRVSLGVIAAQLLDRSPTRRTGQMCHWGALRGTETHHVVGALWGPRRASPHGAGGPGQSAQETHNTLLRRGRSRGGIAGAEL